MNFLQEAAMTAILGALVSLAVSVIIVGTKTWHGALSMDSADGVQKVHKAPTPRVGGISIMLGLVVSLVFLPPSVSGILAPLIAFSVPAFLSGLLEDVTKIVSPRLRLGAAVLSAVLFLVFTGALGMLATSLTPAGASGLVTWLIYGAGVAGIIIGLSGTTNAINIIDGFHGLAAGNLIIMSAVLSGFAAAYGDRDLAVAILVFAGVILGFMAINFPGGYLFLGDGGAYCAGFILGAFAVLLAARTDLSIVTAILVIFYPVYETLFSIMRKRRRDGHSPTQPDGVHLHMLVSRHLSRAIARRIGNPDWKNPVTGMLMWPFSCLAALLAVLGQGSAIASFMGMVVFALFYNRVYDTVSLSRGLHRRRRLS